MDEIAGRHSRTFEMNGSPREQSVQLDRLEFSTFFLEQERIPPDTGIAGLEKDLSQPTAMIHKKSFGGCCHALGSLILYGEKHIVTRIEGKNLFRTQDLLAGNGQYIFAPQKSLDSAFGIALMRNVDQIVIEQIGASFFQKDSVRLRQHFRTHDHDVTGCKSALPMNAGGEGVHDLIGHPVITTRQTPFTDGSMRPRSDLHKCHIIPGIANPVVVRRIDPDVLTVQENGIPKGHMWQWRLERLMTHHLIG